MEDCRLYLLPDLNQSVPLVNDLLLDWIARLTDEYDFDGYRIDTAKHISQGFFPPFIDAADAYCVGKTEKQKFKIKSLQHSISCTYMLGEVYEEEDRTEYIADYQNVMDGVLNYPFYFAMRR